MEIKVIEKKKNRVEFEFENKELPEVLRAVLAEREIDAYTYGPHPLIHGHRLGVEANDAAKELKKASGIVRKDWGEFEELLMKELKK
ncbi:MAG: hypothetical protein A7316_05920 [Candidatus Altiarchaeales archaeon WOR_SM1_86-2]|nr:MAG: hypothetical protein A7315_14965 [Candidatus Altiarchaeales archaeon WOR_SM1_79]ODS39275.1 MAG: hypothetical protein A7316_05920 [Candidatus Altiarchaeales archaeon WOR_SM1_86-2]